MNKILQLFSENKDALTSIGILLTFFISSISLYFSVRNNKAVHYVNAVTKNRVEWIDKLRESISMFLALLNTEDFTETFVQPEEMLKRNYHAKIKELYQQGEKIKVLLNFTDDLDNDLIKAIDLQLINYKLLCEKTMICALASAKKGDSVFVPNSEIYEMQKEMEKTSEEILKYTQIYLKAEWNRVKYESQGKIYEKETQKYDIQELEQKYINSEYKSNKWERFGINVKAKSKRICTSPVFVIFIFLILVFGAIA